MVLSKDMKIAICFGLIMGALISICNLCFAVESIEYSIASGVGIDVTNEVFISSTGSTGYFEIEPGYRYSILNSSGFRRILAFSSQVPNVGDNLHFIQYLENGDVYTFNSSEAKYIYFDMYASGGFSVTREKLEGMTGFVDNLAYDLSYFNLSGVLFFVVPIMSIAILVGLGFYLLKRLLNKIKRAKGGV